MNQRALETVLASIDRLGESLAGRDCAPIEQAITALSGAVASLRGVGKWQDSAELRSVMAQALAAIDAARGRVNVMRDANGRQLDALGAMRANALGSLSYDRTGRQPRTPAKNWI